jgi:hypothetical protein
MSSLDDRRAELLDELRRIIMNYIADPSLQSHFLSFLPHAVKYVLYHEQFRSTRFTDRDTELLKDVHHYFC